MRTVDDIKEIDQLLEEIDELNKQDEEAIARAKIEREKWLEEKRNEEKNQAQPLS